MLMQRVAAFFMKPVPEALQVEHHDERDVLEAAADTFMRLHRARAKIVHGAIEGVPIVAREREFAELALAVLALGATHRYGEHQFYLAVRCIDVVEGWSAMQALRRGLAVHDACPVITQERDIHVIDNQDFVLCKLHVAIRTL